MRLKKVMELVQGIPDDKIAIIGASGSTDMGFLTKYDVIIHGNSNLGSNSHGVNETIKLKDVKTYVKELIVFL